MNAGHHGAITAIKFAPLGGRVATQSRDGTVRIWDVESGELSALFPVSSEAPAPIWVEGGRLAVFGLLGVAHGGIVDLDGALDDVSPDELPPIPGPPSLGRQLRAWARLGGADIVVAYRERASGPSIEHLRHDGASFVSVRTFDVGSASVVDLHAAKDTLAVATTNEVGAWSLSTGRRRWAVPEPGVSVVRVAPDGQSVLGGDDVGGLQRYATSDGESLASYGERVVVVRDVAVWDDAVVALATDPPSLSAWSLEDWTYLGRVDGEPGAGSRAHVVALARIDDDTFWIARAPPKDPHCSGRRQALYVEAWTLDRRRGLKRPKAEPLVWPPDGRADEPWCLPEGELVAVDLQAQYAILQAGGGLAAVPLPDGPVVALEDSPSTVSFADVAREHGWVVAAAGVGAQVGAWSLSNGARARSFSLPTQNGTIDQDARFTLSRSEDRLAMVAEGFGVVLAFPDGTPLALNQVGTPCAAWFAADDRFILGRIDGGHAWVDMPAHAAADPQDIFPIDQRYHTGPDRDGALLRFDASSSNETVVGITLAGSLRVWQGVGAPARLVELANGRWSSTWHESGCQQFRGTLGSGTSASGGG